MSRLYRAVAVAAVLLLSSLPAHAGPQTVWAFFGDGGLAQDCWAAPGSAANAVVPGTPLEPGEMGPNCLTRRDPNSACNIFYDFIFTGGAFLDPSSMSGSSPRRIANCEGFDSRNGLLNNPLGHVHEACPPHSTISADFTTCVCDPQFPDSGGSCGGGKNNGAPKPGGPCPQGNPCSPANGNKLEREAIYHGANGFELTFTFNTYDDSANRVGQRWRDSFDRRIGADTGSAIAYRSDGKAFQYTASGGAWVTDADTADSLLELKNASGARTGWELHTTNEDEIESYDASGRLLAIRSRSGLVQTMTNSDGTGGANGGFILDANGVPTSQTLPVGLLIRASDNFGRVLAFGYDAQSRVLKITDPAGGVYRLAYDGSNNLAAITFPDGKVRTYVYNEAANTGGASLPHALTGIVDENGARLATFRYDSTERSISTEHAGGTLHYTLSYANGSTTVTDPLGSSRAFGLNTVLGTILLSGVSGPACPSCGPTAQTFDANGNVASRTDWNGNRTNYGYDLSRNLETSRTEALTSGGAATPQTRTISTQWHPVFRLPVKVAEPLRITSYVYNGDGGSSCGFQADGATLVPGVLCSKTVQATSDASGAQGFSAAGTGALRTWTYTYNANGSVLTVDGPRTDVSDVTTYAYYANTDPDLGKRRQIATITDALGHVTSITAYNAHGQPLTIVDPNGLVTTLAYDVRMRLTSRSVGGETTTYTYDNAGQLTQVTLPDGSFLSYAYDAAHRLTGISDNQGGRIAYTLDAMGNRTQEQVFDPASALVQTRSRVYDNLNRLAQEIGAQNQTTAYAYDNQGNVVSVTDPLNHVTGNQYDALNRLAQVTDPNLGVTQYGYNALDQLASVTDPRNLATSYNYDGLSNLNSQTSPDTGSTTNTYDAAGNLLTQTDAKGQVTTYAYDALNRVASITFNDGSKQSYAYDLGANGIGRLTSITELDPALAVTAQTAYAYEAHGRVASETRTIAGINYVTGYGYDAAGRLSGMTYPSGRSVAYGFDALGRINQVTTTAAGGTAQTVASAVTYQPFGGVQSYTLGNGRGVTRGFDQDGRIASYTLGAQTFALGYDAASRISFIADAANPANANTYGYDSLDRLTSAVTPGTPFAYGYDAVGNRTSKTVGSSSDTYSYSTTSNRIASITAQAGAVRSFTFDSNGSTTDDGTNQYAYDSRGRMVQSVGALGITSYQVNALGQRIRKTNAQDDRVFHYDTRGRLIAETAPGGGTKREYLYLGDIPVAVVQ
jgi:YD repeat-containing protein